MTIAIGRIFIERKLDLNRQTQYQSHTSIIIHVDIYRAFSEC